MSPSQYQTAEAVLEEAVAGDLIEFKRLGYQHWGVYVGDGYVVNVNLARKADTYAVISREQLVNISQGDNCRVNNLTSQATQRGLVAKSPEMIVQSAENSVDDVFEYNLLGDNCEYFATGCRYGMAFCQQVEDKISTFESVGHFGAKVGSKVVHAKNTISTLANVGRLVVSATPITASSFVATVFSPIPFVGLLVSLAVAITAKLLRRSGRKHRIANPEQSSRREFNFDFEFEYSLF